MFSMTQLHNISNLARSSVILPLMVGLLSGGTALAQRVSGGGQAVVCRDGAKKIKSAELLDLFEGRIQHGFVYEKTNLNRQQLLAQAEAIYKEGTRLPLDVMNSIIFKNFKYLPEKVAKLPIVNDAHNFIIPDNCRIEQVAHFINLNQIIIVSEIWNKMNALNQAALIVHETLYWQARMNGSTSSRRSRFYTAYLFSKGAMLEDVYGDLPERPLTCSAMSKRFNEPGNQVSTFQIYKVADGYRINFTMIGGDQVFSRKTMYLHPEIYPSIVKGMVQDPIQGLDKVGEYRISGMNTVSKIESDDMIYFTWEYEKHPDGKNTAVRLTLSGQSGWDPDKKYDKAIFGCSDSKDSVQAYPSK